MPTTACAYCGATRSDSAYTSPANADRDRRDWQSEHGLGACLVPAVPGTEFIWPPRIGPNASAEDSE